MTRISTLMEPFENGTLRESTPSSGGVGATGVGMGMPMVGQGITARQVRGGLFLRREIKLWAARASSPRALSFDPLPLWVRTPDVTPVLAYCVMMIIQCVTLQLLVYPLNVARRLQGLPTASGPWIPLSAADDAIEI